MTSTSTEPARVMCVAVVSRENRPLFLCCAEGAEELGFHHIVHSSLDIFEERRPGPAPPGAAPQDPYLGLLQPAVDFRVYGYLTSTEAKLVAVLSDGGDAREAELRQLFRRLHGLVIAALSNPFYAAGTPIASAKFGAAARQLVAGAR